MLQTQYWEHPLLDLANAALEGDRGAEGLHTADDILVDTAYKQCQEITRQNSKTFSMAAGLLPPEKRRATHALYAFCRVSDDLIDQPEPYGAQSPAVRLESWREQVVSGLAHPARHADASWLVNDMVSLAWADARRRHRVPGGYVDQLLDGLSLDLCRVRYETFADLSRYCYGVACTVGLMSMHIVGYSGREAIPYAIRLGVALQLTNILRDVGEDWRAGRLYLPLEELRRFGLDESDIAAGRVDQHWREFMRFQIARAHRLYEDALPGVALLHRDGRFAIAAAGELYRAILRRIEQNDYDVFSRRVSVSALGKLRRLPGIWLRAQGI